MMTDNRSLMRVRVLWLGAVLCLAGCTGVQTNTQAEDGPNGSGTPADGRVYGPDVSLPTPFDSVTAGRFHTCGLRADGAVDCWGLGAPATGEGHEFDHGQATPPDGTYRSVDAGRYHTCALTEQGDAICWGRNDEGQTDPPGGAFEQISAGGYHTCGLRANGSVECWGRGVDADRDEGDYDFDQGVAPELRFQQIRAGRYFTCGLRDDETPECWGLGGDRDRDEGAEDVDQAVPPDQAFDDLRVGAGRACGLRSNGRVVCWGELRGGRTGLKIGPFHRIGVALDRLCTLDEAGAVSCQGSGVPEDVTGDDREYRELAVGGTQTCVLDTKGAIDCWRAGQSASSPVADYGQASAPPVRVTDVTVGGYQGCVVLDGRTARCWGGAEATARRVFEDERLLDLQAGGRHSCALLAGPDTGSDETRRLVCWNNEPGARRGEVVSHERKGLGDRLAVGGAHVCAERSEGTPFCRGLGSKQGVFEGGHDFDQANPPEFHSTFSESFDALVAGELATCRWGERGFVSCWGANRFGTTKPPIRHLEQVEEGGNLIRMPVPKTLIADLALGRHHGCRVREGHGDDRLRCWGLGVDPERDEGPGDYDQASPPDEILAGAEAAELAVGRRYSCVLDSSGSVVCWGDDSYAQTSVPEATGFAHVDAATLPPDRPGFGRTCGLTSDRDIVCWGAPPGAKLSPDDRVVAKNSSADSVDTVSGIAAGTTHTCQTSEAGGARCWGDHASGSTQTPDVPMRTIEAGDGYNCALTQNSNVVCWGDRLAHVPGSGYYLLRANGHIVSSTTSREIDLGLYQDTIRRPVDGQFDEISVASSGRRACALRTDGQLRCWQAHRQPYSPDVDGPFETVAVGAHHICAQRTDGNSKCWNHETLSDRPTQMTNRSLDPDYNPNDPSQEPPQPPGDASFRQIAVGQKHACGLAEDGQLTCWGLGAEACRDEGARDYGQAVPPDGKYRRVDTAEHTTCAIDTDGRLRCWGLGSYPTVDEGASDFDQATPPAGNNFVDLAVGPTHACALDASGDTVCWGLGTDPSRREGSTDYNQAWRSGDAVVGYQAGVPDDPGQRRATLTVKAPPSGRLHLDGEAVDERGPTQQKLSPGSYQLRVEFDEYASSRTVAVCLGERGAEERVEFERPDTVLARRLTPLMYAVHRKRLDEVAADGPVDESVTFKSVDEGARIAELTGAGLFGQIGLREGDILVDVAGESLGDRDPGSVVADRLLDPERPVVKLGLQRDGERSRRMLYVRDSLDGRSTKIMLEARRRQKKQKAPEKNKASTSDKKVTGEVTVYSKPKSEIAVDGELTGQPTPGAVEVEVGRHDMQVKFNDGGVSETKTIRVREGADIKLFFRKRNDEEASSRTLERDREPTDQTEDPERSDEEGTGRVTVYSKPKGVILVDDEPTEQTTPGTVQVSTGTHDVQVKYNGGGLSEKKTVRIRESSRIKLFYREKD